MMGFHTALLKAERECSHLQQENARLRQEIADLTRKLERLQEYVEMHVVTECVNQCHVCSKEFLKEIEREAGGDPK